MVKLSMVYRDLVRLIKLMEFFFWGNSVMIFYLGIIENIVNVKFKEMLNVFIEIIIGNYNLKS